MTSDKLFNASFLATLVVSAENGNVFFWDALKGRCLGGFHAAQTSLGNEVCHIPIAFLLQV
jgi:hypothetical protein